jgi:hypothetical protein
MPAGEACLSITWLLALNALQNSYRYVPEDYTP